jgi:DNA repair exonuclease SbcCD ATPase subunit
MILRRLELKHFGKFGERTFEFRQGMNLVVGPNEAGKSTLMEAIPAVLFGLRKKDRFKPWGRQGNSEAVLNLEDRGHTIRIERDILSDRVCLAEGDDLHHVLYSFEGKVSPQGRSSERVEYLEQLIRLFGIADEDVFRASLFFGQSSLEIFGKGGLSTKIKTLLSGFGEVDYDRVLDSLCDDYFAITRQNPWGKDKTRDRELEEVCKRIEVLEKRWFEARKALQELEGLRKDIHRVKESIETDSSEYAKGERYLTWIRKQYRLEEKEEILRRDFSRVNGQAEKVSELEQRRKTLEKELAKTGLPREIPEDLPILLSESEEVRKELVALQEESAGLREQLLAHSAPLWRLSGLLSLLFIVGGGALVWMRPEWLTNILMGSGLLTALVWIVYLRRAGLQHAERSRLKGQAQILERGREEAQVRLTELDERFEKIGMFPSAVDIVKMQRNLERNRQLIDQLREVESALKVLEDSAELTREKEHLTRELAVLGERMERERPMSRNGLIPPEELPDAEEKLKELGESLKKSEKELLELTRKEAALQGALSDLQQIEEEGERLKERETSLTRRKKALAMACELLSGAVEEFRQSYLERLAVESGHYLGIATGGRYDAIRLDDDFSLFLEGKQGNWYSVEHFSRGTVDAVYFAVRLALARHLSCGRRPPLFLDDPMVNFDTARLGETLNALEELSGEHQIILFTHDENLLRRAAKKRWNVVSLEDSKITPPLESEERRENVGQLSFL